MSVLANEIEKYIKQMLAASQNGMIELQRSDLANIFTCVPSQINYVLDTRFANELGYHVESRRGGGGYIRIVKLQPHNDAELLQMIESFNSRRISQQAATSLLARLTQESLLAPREGRILAGLMQGSVLKLPEDEAALLRGRIMKNVLVNLMRKDFEEE